MADAVTALTHWRKGRHTRELVTHELPEAARQVLVRLAEELDRERAAREVDRNRIDRLESVIASLAREALTQ